MPIAFILGASVVGLTPNSFAAPPAPLIFQPVCLSAARMFSRSRRLHSSCGTTLDASVESSSVADHRLSFEPLLGSGSSKSNLRGPSLEAFFEFE